MKLGLSCCLIATLFIVASSDILYAAPETTSRKIDPEAEKYIRELSEYRKNIKNCTLKVFDTIDIMQNDGQKLQFSHIRTLALSLPFKLHIVTTGDLSNRSIWKNRKTLTIMDRDKNVYTQVAAPGTVDEVMDRLLEIYGTRTPLADLISEDIYRVLTANAESIQYVGLNYAGGVKCHHLAAIQKNIDWQIWIRQGEDPCLQKVVITYKKKPGQPQYTLYLQERKVLSSLPDEVFEFKPPAGAERLRALPAVNPSLLKSQEGD